MNYTISQNLHFLKIKVSYTVKDSNLLKLPLWRPGRYQVQNFAKNIRGMKAYRGKEELKVMTVGRNLWKVVGAEKEDNLTVTFEYYAQHKDAGGTWVSDDFWLINGIGCGLLPEGLEEEEIQLKIKYTNDFEVATNAKKKGGKYHFENFEDWTESPLMLGRHMHHKKFEMDKVNFHIWIHGKVQPDWTKLVDDFKKFTRVQLDIFGEFPHDEFHYLILVPDFKHYHGVEHHKNTVITLGPASDFHSEVFYNNLLGVSCHELFHVWNIKQIRPKELMPYDLFQEAYFDTGYVAEGVTTYFGDEILFRSKAFDTQQYIKELNTLLTRHFENLGRHHLSVADSSLELWLDGYEKGIPQRKTSIYVKGAIAALILDAKIKKKFAGEKSLDDVMRLMWTRFGKKGKGYTSNDYQKVAEEVFGEDLTQYFEEVIYGTKSLENQVKKALSVLGFKSDIHYNEQNDLQTKFGIKIDQNGKVTDVENIKSGITEGDKIIAINDIQGDSKQLIALTKGLDKIQISFEREHKLHKNELDKKNKLYFKKIYVTKWND
ncbi:M61 family peptidase [Flammeovirga yaeyamensis]|uniref:M61 family peptidase n=1 Tax=Flammeovirga yaeyamensis TaxID=367791 RepID=A0AAX1MZI4_9BACT|nr:M61 family metallopeptidase [Flammeovirga yaeyamensis]MBB3700333.1 putative metalloprotease with PDZ domain [Flammeovirga yaeyamensis]NMF37041.1 M61 family metallopeptidase [Flammeovirga yaeyamensis]QWG00733.1 M61 family peptidase [Flammeovirga yaeyamensis]